MFFGKPLLVVRTPPACFKRASGARTHHLQQCRRFFETGRFAQYPKRPASKYAGTLIQFAANVVVAFAKPGLRRRRLGRFLAIATVKSIDAARRIDQLLLAGKERMARRTDFHVQIFLFGRARLETLATRASDCYFFVFWVNSGFHFLRYLTQMSLNASIKQAMIRAESGDRQGAGFAGSAPLVCC